MHCIKTTRQTGWKNTTSQQPSGRKMSGLLHQNRYFPDDTWLKKCGTQKKYIFTMVVYSKYPAGLFIKTDV